jgi:peptidoglycan/LPS O-acetylase OafA/YrhL
MLFYCFLVIYPLHKFKNLYVQLAILLLALIFRISPLSANDLPFGLIYLKRFFFWFYLGYFVLYNQDKLKGLYHTLSITLLFASWIVFCILTYYEYMDIRFLNISYVFFVLFFHVLIYKLFHIQKIQVPSWIKKIDQYSYGIYIFHLFFIYLIIEHRINPLYDQTMQYAAQYPVLFPLLLFGYSFLLSLCVAKLLLKTKVGKYLIG